ncbi:MFS transporter [Sphaerisporangium melleum]|uniref:MFS transporter n=1 Tax=Sphaerisporangium melleum TaxID=321316 RepID=A0A917VTX1_9ACTN|nr:MFS transporter [Sphaerisporangium melleum]GGL13778.1 MFS transporter [Sphaerisporangium melleum]GII74626.1 MFS transporter [Sphaerisporangium melleum]
MALPVAVLRSLRHRNYRLWAVADFVSVSGTWAQVLGVNWLILTVTGSAASVGISLVLQALPTLLLGLWGGSLADRLPSRPVVLAAQVAQAALAASLALITMGGLPPMAAVYGIMAASGLVGAITGPALGRFGAEVVPPEDLPNAMALGSVISSAARILGMSLAGALLPLTGTTGLFVVNAVSFLAVIAAVLRMRRGELHVLARAGRSTDLGVREGVRYVMRTPWLLVLLALAFVLGGLGRNYQVTMAAMSAGPLGSGASGYGLLSTVFAVGTVLGGVAVASRNRLSVRLLLGAAMLASVTQMASGLMPGLTSFAALMLPIAAGAVVLDTAVAARAQLGSPDHMRGRVIAVLGVVSAASGAVGGPLLGLMSDTLGPRTTLQLAGLATVMATVLAAAAFARLAGVRSAAAVLERLRPRPAEIVLPEVAASRVS